jgi:hypothetical protein
MRPVETYRGQPIALSVANAGTGPLLLGGEARPWPAAEPAEYRAANVLPLIHEIQQAGTTSHNAIAAALNARGIRTARGRKWSHVQVGMALARAGR